MKKIVYSILISVVAFGLSGCMSNLTSYFSSDSEPDAISLPTGRFGAFITDEYKTLKNEKAIAVARDESGGYAYGYSHSQATQDKANTVAIEECNMMNSEGKVKATCIVYMEGDNDPKFSMN